MTLPSPLTLALAVAACCAVGIAGVVVWFCWWFWREYDRERGKTRFMVGKGRRKK